jgi:hypothetical protein
MVYGGQMARKQSDDSFSEEEATRRFEVALRGARIVGHTPMSEIKPTRPKPKQKVKKQKNRT